MTKRKKMLHGIMAVVVSAAVTGQALSVRAETMQYARAIGEPPEPEVQPAPRTPPVPTKKPPPPAPTAPPKAPAPAEPTAATDEEGFNSSYIWIGLGVAAALAALGGGGGGGGGGGSTPSH